MTGRLTVGLRNSALSHILLVRTRDGGEAATGTLEVVGGLHLGAKAELKQQVYTIGTEVGSDIVLRDSGIAANHARLRYGPGTIEVEAVSGPVILANGEIVPVGHGRRCKLPLDLRLGEASLRLTGPAAADNEQQRPDRWWLAAAAVLAAAAIFITAANNLSVADTTKQDTDPGFTRLAFAAQPDRASDASGFVTGSTDPVTAATAAEAGRQLQFQLEQAGLSGLTARDVGGRVEVSGTLADGQSGAWGEVRSWFDRSYGQNLLLASEVSPVATVSPPRLVLQAIWYGERPYVIAADGTRYHEKAFTSDGWVVEHIGETELLLTKGGAKVALKYP